MTGKSCYVMLLQQFEYLMKRVWSSISFLFVYNDIIYLRSSLDFLKISLLE